MRSLAGVSGQCLLYALVLGALLGLPGIAAYEIGGRDVLFEQYPGPGTMVCFFFVAVAMIIALPAMLAAAIVWWVLLRRHDGAPPADIVPYCWILTLAGTYLLTPFWILITAVALKGISGQTDLLGFGVFTMAVAFLISIPYVAPATYLGAWAWVRRARPAVMTFGT